jgi:hypothetical protein
VGGTGAASPNPIPQVEAYDPATNTWTTIQALLPTPRSGVAVAAANGKLHVFGGSTPTPAGQLGHHDVYDPVANPAAWTAGAAVPAARVRGSLAAVTGPDGRIYLIGGVDTGGNYVGDVDIFDPATSSWATGTNMPTARAGLALCLCGGLIYAIGGRNATPALPTVEVYSPPPVDTWASAGPSLRQLPQARTGLAASAGPGGLIYAIGGLDNTATPKSTVFGFDPSTPSTAWTTQPALLAPEPLLAACVGPDGLTYAIGGDPTAATSAEVLDNGSVQPEPYIGNGTYQSLDIVLTDPVTHMPVKLGGMPGGPWDTLLQPSTDYPMQAVVYNASTTPAPWTAVGFWHFPGGVGTTGTLIDVAYVTVPAATVSAGVTTPGTVTVSSVNPYHSAPAGHQCAVVTVANPQSPYFNLQPTTAAEVVDPTLPQPGGSDQYGSAWRNTDSTTMMAGHIFHFGFAAAGAIKGAVKIEVATAKVPLGWDQEHKAARLRQTLRFLGAEERGPLFLVPSIRKDFEEADLEIEIGRPDEDKRIRLKAGAHHTLEVLPHRPAHFTVSGRIPDDAQPGDAYLLDVAAHYPDTHGRAPSTVRFLEVLYVKEGT